MNVCFSGSLFTNSNWFAFEEERAIHEQSTSSPSPDTDSTAPGGDGGGDEVVTSTENDQDLVDSATSEIPESKPDVDDTPAGKSTDESTSTESDKPTEWIEWREAPEPEPLIGAADTTTTEPAETSQAATASLPNGDLELSPMDEVATDLNKDVPPPSSATDNPVAVAESDDKTNVAVSPPE